MLKESLKRSIRPNFTKYGGVYPYNEKVVERYRVKPRYAKEGDHEFVQLYKVIKDEDQNPTHLMLPRACCPPPKKDLRSRGIKQSFTHSVVPRDEDQEFFINECTRKLAEGRSFVGEAPTGVGKTVMACAIIANHGVVPLVVVNKEDIESQWRTAFKTFLGLDDSEIGIIKGDKCQVSGKKVVIGYVQSLYKEGRYPKWIYDHFGLVIVDEVHKIGATEFSNMVWLFSAYQWLGLSATPKRTDGKDVIIYAHIGDVEVRIESMPLIPKVICASSTFKVPVKPVWDEKLQTNILKQIPHSIGRTAHIDKLLAQNAERNEMIGEFVATAVAQKRYVIIFAQTKNHLKTLEAELKEWGISSAKIAYYVGGMSEKARDAAKKKQVCLATYAMTAEATDNPIWSVGVFATPRADVVQIAGRVLRQHETKCSALSPVEGKHYPVILDVVDSDSMVYSKYFEKRMKWYKKINAPIVM